MLKNEIATCCKRLRLSRNLVDNSEMVRGETFQEYLLELLKLEIRHREASKRERLVKNANFYSYKTFEDFRFDEVKLPSGLTPEDLKQCTFIDEKRNLILYGNVGTGKTHLAIALGIEACRKGLKVGFYRTANLENQLSDAKKSGEPEAGSSGLRRVGLCAPGPGRGAVVVPGYLRQL